MCQFCRLRCAPSLPPCLGYMYIYTYIHVFLSDVLNHISYTLANHLHSCRCCAFRRLSSYLNLCKSLHRGGQGERKTKLHLQMLSLQMPRILLYDLCQLLVYDLWKLLKLALETCECALIGCHPSSDHVCHIP